MVNYDMPANHEIYLHRSGRKDYLASKGVAINFVTGADFQLLRGLEQYYNISINELPQDFDII